jgi:hypothetical protein
MLRSVAAVSGQRYGDSRRIRRYARWHQGGGWEHVCAIYESPSAAYVPASLILQTRRELLAAVFVGAIAVLAAGDFGYFVVLLIARTFTRLF